MKAPKKITEQKVQMTAADIESENYARQAQTGDLNVDIEKADEIIRTHNARPGVVQLITRTEWIRNWEK